MKQNKQKLILMKILMLWRTGLAGLLFISFTANAEISHHSEIYVFISSSMPETSLRQWLVQSQLIDAHVIMRGMVNHSLESTVHWFQSLMGDLSEKTGIEIDPTYFERFGITQVPAVVVSKNLPCSSSQSCLPTFDIVYGNLSLIEALKKISNQEGATCAEAQAALNRLTNQEKENVL